MTVTQKEDDEELKAWFEANPDSKEEASLQFPVEASFAGKDEVVTINTQEELTKLKKACYEDDKKDDKKEEQEACLELVYPVTYVLPDGSTVNISEKEDYEELKAWFEANPDSKEEASLQYPVNVRFADRDEIVNVGTEAEMIELKKACEEDTKDDKAGEEE